MTPRQVAAASTILFALGCSSGGGSGTSTGGSTTSGSSTGGGTTSAGTGGTGGTTGGTTGSLIVGACSAQIKPQPLVPCLAPFPCGCPLSCVFDPAFGGSVCEVPCISSESCTNVTTRCVEGFCQLNACAATPLGEGAAGSLNGTCDAAGSLDGTCIPAGTATLDDGGSGPTWGVCVQGGTSDGGCQADAGRGGNDQLLCPAGDVCASGLGCKLACDPTIDVGCDGGSCTPLPGGGNAHAGYCGELRGQTACGPYAYGPFGMSVGQALPWAFQDLGYWNPTDLWVVDGGVPNPSTNAYFDLLYCARQSGARFALVQLVSEDDNHGQGQAVDFSRHVNGPDAYWLGMGGQVIQVLEIGHSGFPPSQDELTAWVQNNGVNFSIAIDTNQVLLPMVDASAGWPVTFIVDLSTMQVLIARSYAADVGQIDLDFSNYLASDGG